MSDTTTFAHESYECRLFVSLEHGRDKVTLCSHDSARASYHTHTMSPAEARRFAGDLIRRANLIQPIPALEPRPCPDCNGTGYIEGRFGNGPLERRKCQTCAPEGV